MKDCYRATLSRHASFDDVDSIIVVGDDTNEEGEPYKGNDKKREAAHQMAPQQLGGRTALGPLNTEQHIWQNTLQEASPALIEFSSSSSCQNVGLVPFVLLCFISISDLLSISINPIICPSLSFIFR